MTIQFKYPIYFVTPRYDEFRELEEGELPEFLDPYFEKCLSGQDIWGVQSFIHLKQRGLNVHLTPKFLKGEICVVQYHELKAKDMPFDSYVLGVRTDSPTPYLCEQRIVINRLALKSSNEHYMDNWPQPVTQARLESRGSRLENIEFKGRKTNLWAPFQEEAFLEQIDKLGANFKSTSEEAYKDHVELYRHWGDYKECDLLIAIRNMTVYDAELKPALKLVNAWLAGVPAILGPEPAYRELRQSEYDFIEVKSPQEVIEAIKMLKQKPEFYQKMVENGKQRAQEFTTEKVAEHWQALLAGPVTDGYERWKKRGLLHRIIFDKIKFIFRVIKQKKEVKHYKKMILVGQRILEI